MIPSERLIAELKQESIATRRLLERIPNEKLGWKPHAKSTSLGELAMHIALLPKTITHFATEAQYEVSRFSLPVPKSSEELVSTLDDSIAFAVEKISGWDQAALGETWRMVSQGKTLIEIPRVAVLRSMLLNHWYHHRGQLTVYLRMLDVPLPSVYGPTADESIF